MPVQARSPLALLLPLLATLGCDAQDEELLPVDEIEERIAVTPTPLFQPYHGRWEGPMTQVNGIAQADYDATIQLAPGFCTVSGNPIQRARWDYYNLGVVCTSELELLGVGMANGIRTWTFFDSNVSGGCLDGFVDLTETNDPNVMEHTWRDLSGVVDAQGPVTRIAVCGNPTP